MGRQRFPRWFDARTRGIERGDARRTNKRTRRPPNRNGCFQGRRDGGGERARAACDVQWSEKGGHVRVQGKHISHVPTPLFVVPWIRALRTGLRARRLRRAGGASPGLVLLSCEGIIGREERSSQSMRGARRGRATRDDTRRDGKAVPITRRKPSAGEDSCPKRRKDDAIFQFVSVAALPSSLRRRSRTTERRPPRASLTSASRVRDRLTVTSTSSPSPCSSTASGRSAAAPSPPPGSACALSLAGSPAGATGAAPSAAGLAPGSASGLGSSTSLATLDSGSSAAASDALRLPLMMEDDCHTSRLPRVRRPPTQYAHGSVARRSFLGRGFRG